MTTSLWRPSDEAAAVGGMAVFAEWLRATGRMAMATPDQVRRWQAADRAAFLAAVGGFAGFDAKLGARANLLRHHGTREALVVFADAVAPRAWSRDDLRAGRDLPPAVAHMLSAADWQDLLALAADHLFRAGTRPDDRLIWTGDAAALWPYGAWIVGATVVLAAATG